MFTSVMLAVSSAPQSEYSVTKISSMTATLALFYFNPPLASGANHDRTKKSPPYIIRGDKACDKRYKCISIPRLSAAINKLPSHLVFPNTPG